MAVQTFGVTASAVRKKHLPMMQDFSTSSAPTLADVGDYINEGAGELEGKLARKGIAAASVALSGITTAGYLWCAKYVRMYAAVEAIANGAACEPEAAKRLSKKLDGLRTDLEDGGAEVLGEGASSSSIATAEGLVTTQDVLGLDVGSTSAASDLVPPFRKRDNDNDVIDDEADDS